MKRAPVAELRSHRVRTPTIVCPVNQFRDVFERRIVEQLIMVNVTLVAPWLVQYAFADIKIVWRSA